MFYKYLKIILTDISIDKVFLGDTQYLTTPLNCAFNVIYDTFLWQKLDHEFYFYKKFYYYIILEGEEKYHILLICILYVGVMNNVSKYIIRKDIRKKKEKT